MTSNSQNSLTLWIYWQFYKMPKFLLEVWNNYILFASNFFSLKELLKSFFSPWRKYKWSYPRGFDVAEFFNTFISNTFSRFLGALMRIVLIIAGLVFQIFVIFAGAIIFFLWVATPFIVIAGFLFLFLY